jgi:hypothetical protein
MKCCHLWQHGWNWRALWYGNKPDTESQVLNDLMCLWKLKNVDRAEVKHRTEIRS